MFSNVLTLFVNYSYREEVKRFSFYRCWRSSSRRNIRPSETNRRVMAYWYIKVMISTLNCTISFSRMTVVMCMCELLTVIVNDHILLSL